MAASDVHDRALGAQLPARAPDRRPWSAPLQAKVITHLMQLAPWPVRVIVLLKVFLYEMLY